MQRSLARTLQRGFTLIEVMIAMLIGMIGIIVIMQVYSVSEGYKRTATSGTDAQINGAMALYLIEREIRLAGYGMNAMIPSGCTSIVVFNANTGTTAAMRMVPFEINPAGIPAGDAATDTILIAYGNADNFPIGVSATQPSNSSSNYKVTNNRDAFRAGDLVVAVQPGAGAGGGPSCLMQELTGVPGSGGNCGSPANGGSDVLNHNTGKYKSANQACNMVSPVHNSPGGVTDPATGNPMPGLTAPGGMLYDLGALPQVKVYAIRNQNLTWCDYLNTDCTVLANYNVLVPDIVSLRAVYGMDLDGNPNPTTPQGDGKVDMFTRAPLTTPNQISRVLAASVQITARSNVKEKVNSKSLACDATSLKTRPDRAQDWFGPTLAPNDGTLGTAAQIDLSNLTDWQCYRYKLFQTTVPLRNLIWRP